MRGSIGVLVVTVVLAGCLPSATTPTGLNGDEGVTPDAAFTASLSDGPTEGGITNLQGTLIGRALVTVYRDPGGWHQIGDTVSITLPLQGSAVVTLASDALVPSGTYTRTRLYLRESRVELAPGSVVEGVTLEAPLSITVGGRDALVPILIDYDSLSIDAERGGNLTFDLRSKSWIDARAVRDSLAQDAPIQDAVVVIATVR